MYGIYDKAKHGSVSVGRICERTKVNAIPVCLCPRYIIKGVGGNYSVNRTLPLMLSQRF